MSQNRRKYDMDEIYIVLIKTIKKIMACEADVCHFQLMIDQAGWPGLHVFETLKGGKY